MLLIKSTYQSSRTAAPHHPSATSLSGVDLGVTALLEGVLLR
jgi:hypothetical protein